MMAIGRAVGIGELLPVLLLSATGAWAEVCDGALTEAFVAERPEDLVLTCALGAGLS